MLKIIFVLSVLIVIATGQGFRAGRALNVPPISGRAVKPITELCKAVANANKRYCNGGTNNICDATGFFHCNSLGTSGPFFACANSVPYCIEDVAGEARCAEEPDPTCTIVEPEFFCTSEGVLPDPLDCKKYYYCSAEAAVGEPFVCDDLYVFDPSGPKQEYCRLTKNRYCTTAQCDGAFKNILLTYTFFPKSLGQIAASCQGTSPAIMYRCEKGFEANLNKIPIECSLTCTGPKKAAFPTDEKKYYDCGFNGSRWESKIKSCFATYIFNPVTTQCEKKA